MKKEYNSRKYWTSEKEEELRRRYTSKESIDEIAADLDRTVHDIRYHAWKMGLKRPSGCKKGMGTPVVPDYEYMIYEINEQLEHTTNLEEIRTLVRRRSMLELKMQIHGNAD